MTAEATPHHPHAELRQHGILHDVLLAIGGWLEALDDAIGERALNGGVLSRDNVVTTKSRFSPLATRLQGAYTK
jgi:hypothetical protein